MGHISNMKRSVALLTCLALSVLAGPFLSVTAASATGPYQLAPFPANKVDLVGYGDGPGLGMGQWGALGYAVERHKTYRWILRHYYGGTTLSEAGNLASDDPTVSVDVNENDGHPLVVTSDSPFSFGGISFPAGTAARAKLASGLWSVSRSSSCTSKKWVRVASGLINPVAVPSSATSDATADQVLQICEHGGIVLSVRGTVQAYAAPNGAVTLNELPLEQYVADVVPAEESWSWGVVGGKAGAPQSEPWGFQALEAQAVATRSYVAAELAAGGWEPYATTCDTYCQSYSGIADEAAVVDDAVADTAGEILVERPATGTTTTTSTTTTTTTQPSPTPAHGHVPAQPGTPVLAEYSASTGGYTGGGPFPKVVDRGDSVCFKSPYYTCNPCHKWKAVITVHAIEKAFKSVGPLAAIEVTGRNGVGALGGRVESLEIVGTAGVTLAIPSYELGPLIAAGNPDHCSSDWFAVTNGP